MTLIKYLLKSLHCNKLVLKLNHRIIHLEKTVNLYRYDELTGFKLRHDYNKDITNSCDNSNETYLTIIDINRLHHINEEHGYLAGDRHIATISKAIKRKIPDGTFYRIGGDEFAVIHHKPLFALPVRNTVHSTVLLSEYSDYRAIMDFVKEDLSCKKELWYNVKGLDRRE